MSVRSQSNSYHPFGGNWTEVKLDAVFDYCHFFNKVLVGQPTPNSPFQRWYIDAFAGSGTRTVRQQTGGLFDGEQIQVVETDVPGSATRALAVNPSFDRFFLSKKIDRDTKRYWIYRNVIQIGLNA